MIKSQGKWSTKLHQIFSSSSSDQINHLSVSVEGPYDPTSTDFLRLESLVMISGGSGITPFISIIRDLLYMISSFQRTNIKAFVTQEKPPVTVNEPTPKRHIIKTLSFKPNVSDQPISPILGPNSWLCLGTILISSFIIFIVIIAIITRYHIDPIDKSLNKYTSAYRSLFYLLSVSIGVITTSTVAMLWNRRKYDTENNQYIDVLSLLPIESSLQELLWQSTNIHYGERPNLKKLLVDLNGSSVGVLVCSPRKMRQEVAKICSFRSAENLQFESISFSW